MKATMKKSVTVKSGKTPAAKPGATKKMMEGAKKVVMAKKKGY